MIAVDTSALIAIMTGEVEGTALAERLRDADRAIMGMPTVLEARMALLRRIGPGAVEEVDQALADMQITAIDFTATHLAVATDAFNRFGKRRHAAALNYGDCMAYAIAAVAGCSLLYKGDDFARTDIRSAL